MKQPQSIRQPQHWKAQALNVLLAGITLITPLELQAAPIQKWSQGTYIWDSQTLLSSQRQQKELDRLQQLGFNELLVGLTGSQVKQGQKTKQDLQQLIQAAKMRGLKVSLLLGDPDWIEPTGRPELIKLIQRYQALPFDGLHLDLEVEQLGWPVPPKRLQEWVITLKQANDASPWPVSISSHPRWFEDSCNQLSNRQKVCIPKLIGGIDSISLMMYQRNPDKVRQRSLAIARQWPQLRFRLAQSVESQLSKEESWHGVSAGQLQQQVNVWRQALSGAGIKGVDWQDWAQYPKEN